MWKEFHDKQQAQFLQTQQQRIAASRQQGQDMTRAVEELKEQKCDEGARREWRMRTRASLHRMREEYLCLNLTAGRIPHARVTTAHLLRGAW